MSGKKRGKGQEPGSPPGSDRDARSTRQWSASEKLRVVGAAAQLKDEELGAFLRREGVHTAQLDEWRSEVLAALGGPVPAPAPSARDNKRIRKLEKELAEVKALLVLRKKMEALFKRLEEEGGSTDDENDEK